MAGQHYAMPNQETNKKSEVIILFYPKFYSDRNSRVNRHARMVSLCELYPESHSTKTFVAAQ